MRVFLSGPMGAGKSSVGRRLAERRGVPFVDLDAEIARAAGTSIEALFRREGERGFRRREREAALGLREGACVVALGGGAVLDPVVRHACVDTGALITLMASPAELARRVGAQDGGASRPLLEGDALEGQLAALVEARGEAYAECHAEVRTDGLDVDGACERVQAVVEDLPVPVLLGRRTYRVEIGAGTRARVTDRAAVASGRVVLVRDGGPERPWPEDVRGRLEAAGRDVTVVAIEGTEATKTSATAAQIWDAALAAGVDRDALVVGVGGGVLGDLTAFAASTLLRGVALGQVPTTLLAMVDSSVGGKTGFNRPAGKNLVGTFYQPRFVLCDVETLETLPIEEVRAGLAEVVKSAWLDGEASVAQLERDAEALAACEPDAVVRAIRMAVSLKARVVREDEREAGRRMLLNLGHTIGHGLEAAAHYRGLRHGEAVALGMIAALRVGRALGRGAADGGERLTRLLEALRLPTDLDARLGADALRFIGADKKRRGDQIAFVVPGDPGDTAVVPLSLQTIERAVSR
ncbi:MAG: 3-dehydroquinate synthase [Myxococcales bacterium]|nr:3-dehydroquinate synthase [Myxococcales bacterium]